MNVILTLRCLQDYIPKDIWSRQNQSQQDQYNMMIEEIKAKALLAWQARQPNATEVQFIHKMDQNYFRFFSVKQKNENTLEVDH